MLWLSNTSSIENLERDIYDEGEKRSQQPGSGNAFLKEDTAAFVFSKLEIHLLQRPHTCKQWQKGMLTL